jgi:hypothetical protein
LDKLKNYVAINANWFVERQKEVQELMERDSYKFFIYLKASERPALKCPNPKIQCSEEEWKLEMQTAFHDFEEYFRVANMGKVLPNPTSALNKDDRLNKEIEAFKVLLLVFF